MKVTRLQIVARGLCNRCPNCGGRTLFKPGTLFSVNPECPRCGLKIERDEGFFLGSMSLNYGFTLVVFLTPIFVLAYRGTLAPNVAIVIGGIGAVLVPALFYRSSRSWWLMNYYFFLPQHLPANQDASSRGEDDNV
jgi:DNA-directed RNA polymerase subunit RPC12/RpoP